MNNAPSAYTRYQQLLMQSQAMLTLAASGQWDALIACEMDYVSAVFSLTAATNEITPTAEEQRQIRPLLRTILDNEQQIKNLLQARMDELAKMVDLSAVQKSVLSAYGKQGGNVLAPHGPFGN